MSRRKQPEPPPSSSSGEENLTPARTTKKNGKIEDRYKYLGEMTNRACQMFTVSQLFNLDLSEVALKRCGKILRERINGILVSRSNKVYRVQAVFRVRKELAETNHDNDALTIEVVITPVVDDEEEEEDPVPKVIYSGYLLCRGLRKKLNGVAQLPILLAFRATQKIVACVNTTLEVLFDCIVRPAEFTSDDMQLLFTSSLLATRDTAIATLGLQGIDFGVREFAEVMIETDKLKSLVQRLQQESRYEDVSEDFFRRLNHLMKEHLHGKLGGFQLMKFQLGNFVLHKSGRFRVNSETVLANFLRRVCLMVLQKEISELSGAELKLS